MLPITVMAVSGMIEKSVAHNPEWITGLGVGIHLLILYEIRTGAVTDKSQPRHKKYTQFYREEGVFFGIIYV